MASTKTSFSKKNITQTAVKSRGFLDTAIISRKHVLPEERIISIISLARTLSLKRIERTLVSEIPGLTKDKELRDKVLNLIELAEDAVDPAIKRKKTGLKSSEINTFFERTDQLRSDLLENKLPNPVLSRIDLENLSGKINKIEKSKKTR